MTAREWSCAFIRQTATALGVFLVLGGAAEYFWPGSVLAELGVSYYLGLWLLPYLIVIAVCLDPKDSG